MGGQQQAGALREEESMAAASTKRITLADLRKRAREGDLTEKELRAYFEVDEERSEPFAPAIRLKYARVDTGGKQLSPEKAGDLYYLATEAPKEKATRTRSRRTGKSARSLRAAAASTKVLAEGDSWFNLPDFLFPKDAIDVLRQTHNLSSVAKWGDTMENMLQQRQYVQKLQSGNFRHFLFSGGGNDVLGSIGAYVKPCTPGDTNSANAPNYVKPSFATKVSSIITKYGTLADEARQAEPLVVLYVHGYANAIPVKGKKYLGKPLEALGFNPSGSLAAAIVAHMVGIFNTALKDFAASRAGVVYVDLRPKVGQNDWHSDEIHPKATGATKIANAFAAAMAANVA
jgi:lysophospholipase L1-like esterase